MRWWESLFFNCTVEQTEPALVESGSVRFFHVSCATYPHCSKMTESLFQVVRWKLKLFITFASVCS